MAANKKLPFVVCALWKFFSKQPFVGRVFWKVFAATVVLLVAGWILIPRVFGYEIESQDYGGSSICAPILAYLIHLWILPGPDSERGDE